MYKTDKLDNPTFPNHYVPNSVKNSFKYGRQVFHAIMNATSAYREERNEKLTKNRDYAEGKQPLKRILDELNIDGNNMYQNVSFTPTPILGKFEKVVIDDYQQLNEEPKAIAESYVIQERKDRRKSDLKFRMDFGGEIENLQQLVGFQIEDDTPVPADKDEYDLITSLQPDEREELLMNEIIEFVLEDNDFESKKRRFLSDIFQVNFAGLYSYVDTNGRLKIDFVANEDAIYDFSKEESLDSDGGYQGSRRFMSISDIRSSYGIKPDQEHLLYKLAYSQRNSYGNNNYNSLSSNFAREWRDCLARPYDDFSVEVYHIWYKTLKRVGYVEGKDSYGKTIFDIDYDLENPEELLEGNNNKRTGASYSDTAYEGLFAGDGDVCLVLEWGEQPNQVRKGAEKEKVESPYIFFMPDNRGSMTVDSAVTKVIPQINIMDITTLKIKMTIAQHAPSGFAIDLNALMNVDLGTGGILEPLEISDIYQQTGRLYYNGKNQDGSDAKVPIQAMNTDLINPINGYLLIYNNAVNEIRDILGINPNREGTADLNRVSNTLAQTQIAISQTATYYIYRAYIKCTEKLLSQIGIRTWDALKYGKKNVGYLKYLGDKNVEFIKSREDITSSTYRYKLNLQMSQEDKARLDGSINACLTAGTLEMPDALMIWNIKDVNIAEKMLSYIFNKRKKEAQQTALENSQAQAQATAQAGVAVEQEKQNTIQIQSQLDIQRAEVNSEGEKERALSTVVASIIKANVELGTPIPDMYLPLVEAYIESHTIRQEHQQVKAEMAIAQEQEQLQQQEQIAQIQQSFDNGDITQDEAEAYISELQAQ